ncbi:MAG: TolC family protein, partial [Thermoguttaceae bacterium]|nr:TolC family protein [Thermoguttaceae bacterium]
MKPYFQRGVALSALLALAVGGGCKVGSDYQKPNVAKQVSASYSETKEEAQVSLRTGEDVSGWWRQINDPVLAQLTQEAVSGNLTLQEALFRIQAARAALGSTNSNLLPQVAQSGGYTHQTYGGHSQSLFSTATSMSWEIDVFGRIQRSIEAANADMEVQRWLYRDAYVILVADVAQAYVDARSYQDQIRSAKINIMVQDGIVRYFTDLNEAEVLASR